MAMFALLSCEKNNQIKMYVSIDKSIESVSFNGQMVTESDTVVVNENEKIKYTIKSNGKQGGVSFWDDEFGMKIHSDFIPTGTTTKTGKFRR